MIKKHKTLLFVLSLLMISLISFNTSFINAKSNKTIINFIDEDSNQLDIKDTVSIVKLEDQGGTKVPVSVYIKDGKETIDYDNGTPLNELEIKDGKLEIEGLTKDDEYLISFDNDYVFKKEVDEEVNYFLFGSFKSGSETYISSSDLKSVDELTFEQLEEIAGNKEIMELATGRITVTVSCDLASSVRVSEVDGTYSAVTCNNSGKSAICYTSATATGGSYDIRVTCDGYVNNFTWNTITSSKSYNCTACGYVVNPVCARNTTRTSTCSYYQEATQYYDSNGGSCDKGSDKRSKAATYRTDSCKTDGSAWVNGPCDSSYWRGSVSAPSCSKGDTTDYATVTYNGNKGSGSTNVTLSKTSDSISRKVHYNFDGFSNYQTAFIEDTTAYAQYSVSSRDSYPSVQLPTAYRDGYTFTGWSTDGNTYNEEQWVSPGGDKTYTATWSPNSYEYTIEFRSSTGKLLDTRKETHKFDETVTISHDPIPGYEVSDQQVKWDVFLNEHTPTHTITITYQIITYDIEYSLEVGNRYPSGNPTVNPNSSITTYNVESNTITFLNPTRTGYTFIGWFTEEGFINEKPSIPNGSVGNVKVYAKFEANSYPLTVTNTNDRVSVTGTINGEAYTLAPKQSITKQIVFDSDFTVTSDSTDPIYYTSDIRNHTTKDSYRSETISSKSLATSMGGTESGNLSYSLEVGATRNTKTFTVELKNDNGEHDVENTVTVKIYDNLTGNLLSEISDETINMESGKQGNTVVKTDTVSPNSSKTITYVIPENTHLEVSTTNNSIQTVGYDNSSTGKTADYLTLVETPSMYSSKAKDIERKSYDQELGASYVVFTTFDNAKDEYKGTTYPVMVVDNQYTKANYAFTSANTATFKLYECLTEDCTVKYNVQATEHDSNYNYYASIVSSEVEGESRELGSLSGASGTFKYVDRYKTYKIVQESLVKDRYYSWDSGYSISTKDYNGYNTGAGTLELNKKSKMIKIDTAGVQYEPMFGGSTILTGKGGSTVTSNMEQHATKVTVKATTGSGIPVAGVEMYFGAGTSSVSANKNIYVAAPTTKTGITFSSDGGSGKALQPDIYYNGYLGGSWVTDLSGNYAPFNGYLADDSWYKEVSLPMAHYENEDKAATNFDLVIDTAKLTLKAKTDIGNLNAVFNVIVGNTTYNYGTDGENGEMIKSTSTIVMHLGEDIDRCTGDEINKVCLNDDGYYSYTIDVPVDKLITVKNVNSGLYYDVKQTCDVDTDKYACRSYVAESVVDEHTEVFDFTRQKAVINVESVLDNVKIDRSVINTVTFTVKETQNLNKVCNVGSYCEVWNDTFDWSAWNELADNNAKFVNNGDGTMTYTFELNPKTDKSATTSFVIPAGLEYTTSAKVKLEDTKNWISNFINGIYGLAGSDKYNSGYHTFVTDGTGLAVKGENNKVVLNTNDYEYARINISSNSAATFDIYDKNGTKIHTVTFGSAGTKAVDVAFDDGPYTVKQNGSVAGFYVIEDHKVTVVEKDGSYDLDMSQDTVDFSIAVYGNLPEKGKTPITNISYAIGEDADHIIYSGTLNEEGQLFSSEAKLEAGKTYKIFVGGKVVDGVVSDYYGITTLSIPSNSPKKTLATEVMINFVPKKTDEGGDDPNPNPDDPERQHEFITRTITTNDVFGTLTNHFKMTLSEDWTFDAFINGVYEDDIDDDSSKTVYIPTMTIDSQKGVTYTFKVNDTFGYTTEVSDEADYKVENANEAVISIVNTPLKFNVEISNTNSAYDDVPVEGIKYGIYDNAQLDEDGNPKKIGEIITDENGKATVELEYGKDHDYFIKQDESKFGYKDDETKYPINPTDPFIFGKDVIKVDVEQEAYKYKVTYNFYNKEFNDVAVEDVEYSLVDEVTGEVIKYTADKDGKISFELDYGHDHKLVQSNVPYGYKLTEDEYSIHMNEDYPDFNFEKDEIKETGYVEPESFDIKIHGTNSVFTDVKPEGVEYTIYNGSKCEMKDRPEPKLEIDEPIKPVEPVKADYKDTTLYNEALAQYKKDLTEYQVKLAEYNEAKEIYEKAHKTWESNKQIKVCEIVDIAKTDENGEVHFNVVYGQDYYVEQTETIFGYKPAKDEIGDNTKWEIELDEKYPEFKFGEDEYDLEINPEPYKYTIVITKKDDSGNPVEGTEYTTYDKETGELPIEGAVKEPVQKTDKDGKAEIEVTWGHDYIIIETDTPDGYEKPTVCEIGEENDKACQQLEPTLPDDFDFDDEDEKKEIDDYPAKGNSFKVQVSGKDARTGATLETTYHLYDNQAKKDVETVKGNGTLIGKYSQKKTWTVKADTPFGYFGADDQDVKIEFNKDGTIKNSSMEFKFTPKTINVNVLNTVKGDVLTLYDKAGNVVQTKKATSNLTPLDSMKWGESYYVKVKHPYGYYADNNSYPVELPETIEFKDGVTWAKDIKLKKAIWINTEKNRYGIEITVKDEDGNPVKGVEVGLYNKTTGKLLTDSYSQSAKATTDKDGVARIYPFEGTIGVIKQISVPEGYELSEEIKSYTVTKTNIVKSSEMVKEYVEVEFTNKATEEPEKEEDDTADKNKELCNNARIKLQQFKDSLKKSDYKKADWNAIQAKIAEIEAEIEGVEGCNLDTSISKDLFDYDGALTELNNYVLSFTKRGHWMHIIVVAVSLFAIIINIAFTKKFVNIPVSIINLLVGVVITVFFDACIISIIATILATIINVVILILHNRDDDDDDDDYEDEDSDELYIPE